MNPSNTTNSIPGPKYSPYMSNQTLHGARLTPHERPGTKQPWHFVGPRPSPDIWCAGAAVVMAWFDGLGPSPSLARSAPLRPVPGLAGRTFASISRPTSGKSGGPRLARRQIGAGAVPLWGPGLRRPPYIVGYSTPHPGDPAACRARCSAPCQRGTPQGGRSSCSYCLCAPRPSPGLRGSPPWESGRGRLRRPPLDAPPVVRRSILSYYHIFKTRGRRFAASIYFAPGARPRLPLALTINN